MKRFTPAASLVALLALSPGAADAACSLAGKWDAYFTLAQLDDDTPWPSVVANCIFTMSKNGRLTTNGIKCSGMYNGSEYDIYMETFNFKVTRGCRVSQGSDLFFEVQTELVQTQDIYQCGVSGTMQRDGQAVHGQLDCGAEPRQFSMIRR